MRKQKRKVSPITGKPYPRCQRCPKTVYADGLCWSHFQGYARDGYGNLRRTTMRL